MRPTAKPHPTDQRDQQWIAEAIYFTAFCQRGPRDRRRVQVDVTADRSRDQARVAVMAEAQLLANQMGKAALVYAVTAAGRSAHVTSVYPSAPADTTPAEEGQTMTTTTAKTYSNRANAKRAALAAGCADPVITATDTGFAWGPRPADDGAAYVAAVEATDAAEATDAIFGAANDMPAGVAAAGLAEAMGGPLATEAVAADRAKADQLVQARDQGGNVVVVCPNDPLLVGGVLYANKTRATEARRLQAEAAKRPTKAKAPTPNESLQTIVATRKAKADKAPQGKRAEVLAAAQAGVLPTPPSPHAPSNAKYAPDVAALVDLAKAGDVAGLRAFPINPVSSFRKAMDRYRQLAITALEAKAKA